tara:strand:+ start:874 stop:1407 length:534 start_codon:yes stop_codon:yes gene_type:complete
MKNRSKKVVLSARVEPYIKAALDLYAVSKNEKIVKVLEQFIESKLEDIDIRNPLRGSKDSREKIPFMTMFTAIWSEDEVVYKLRAGLLGSEVAGKRDWHIAIMVAHDHYFNGDYDLYGDLNGLGSLKLEPQERPTINLELVKSEWDLICGYVDFLENNKPFSPTYEDYKRMHESSVK